MPCARTRSGLQISFVLVGGVALGGCYNPSQAHSGSTDGTDSATETATETAPSSSATSATTASTSPSEATTTPADSSSSTEPTGTSLTTTDATDGTSTGEVSDCPGGAPTAGDAPYVVSTVDTTQDANDVDVGDINGDGHLDFISLSRIDGAVETFWGDGAGGLVSDGVTALDMQGYPDTVRLGAIADDTVDLFVHMEGPVELWVVRGDGAGNWPSPQVYTGTYVRAIDLADLNDDGVLDLAYVGASNLEVRIGQATETYANAALYGMNYGGAVRIADITGDGHRDILTADYGSTELQIYSGVGDGTFQAEPTVVTGSPISGIDVGLLDNDDLLDLVLTTEDDLRAFYGEEGGGVSSTPGTIIPDALTRVRVADIDADGAQDLITRDGTTIQIRFSGGDETFSDAVPFECPAGFSTLEVGDFNEDCVPDLVAPMGSEHGVCVLLSDRG